MLPNFHVSRLPPTRTNTTILNTTLQKLGIPMLLMLCWACCVGLLITFVRPLNLGVCVTSIVLASYFFLQQRGWVKQTACTLWQTKTIQSDMGFWQPPVHLMYELLGVWILCALRRVGLQDWAYSHQTKHIDDNLKWWWWCINKHWWLIWWLVNK